MQKNPIGWIEVPVTDLDRAEKFYTDYFGYEMSRQEEKNGWTMSWFPMNEGYGAAGTLIKGEGYTPSYEGSVAYFSVARVDESLKKAEEMGVKIILPKQDIGEHGFFAFIEDSEGNRIAIHSTEG